MPTKTLTRTWAKTQEPEPEPCSEWGLHSHRGLASRSVSLSLMFTSPADSDCLKFSVSGHFSLSPPFDSSHLFLSDLTPIYVSGYPLHSSLTPTFILSSRPRLQGKRTGHQPLWTSRCDTGLLSTGQR